MLKPNYLMRGAHIVKTTALDGLIRAFENRKNVEAPRFKKIKIGQLPGFRDFEISPNSDFVAICGGTGTGKTALLELLYAGLGYEHLLPEREQNRLGEAKLELELQCGAVLHKRSFDTASPNADLETPIIISLLDLGRRTVSPLLYFKQKGSESVREGSDRTVINERYVDLCSYICRKDYKEISFIEVDDEDQRYPYFFFKTSKTEYDSFSASTGELSVIYMVWALTNAEPNSIFLIEEPEAYLPPVGQAAVVFALYKAIVEFGHSILLTTHSAEIVSKIPGGEIISLRSHQGLSEIPAGKTSKARVLVKLGLGPARTSILFVEDEASKDVTEEILASSSLADLVSFEVVKAGNGDGAVKKATEAIPSTLKSVHAVGVLDGDMREKSKKWKTIERFCFTPFETGIEAEMLDVISEDPASFAERVGRNPDKCIDALESIQGVEVHQRFAELAKSLGMSSKSLRGHAYPLWLASGENEKKVSAFLNELSSKLGIPI